MSALISVKATQNRVLKSQASLFPGLWHCFPLVTHNLNLNLKSTNNRTTSLTKGSHATSSNNYTVLVVTTPSLSQECQPVKSQQSQLLKLPFWFHVKLQKTNNNELKQLHVAEAAAAFPPHSNLVYQRHITVLPRSYYMCILLFKKLLLYFSGMDAALFGRTLRTISFLKCCPSIPKFLRKKRKKIQTIPPFCPFYLFWAHFSWHYS